MSYKARKKNRVITIPEEKAEEYASMGYEVKNDNGDVIADAIISSIADARQIIKNLEKENADLKEKLEESGKKIEELQIVNAELKAKEESETGDSKSPEKETPAQNSKKAE